MRDSAHSKRRSAPANGGTKPGHGTCSATLLPRMDAHKTRKRTIRKGCRSPLRLRWPLFKPCAVREWSDWPYLDPQRRRIEVVVTCGVPKAGTYDFECLYVGRRSASMNCRTVKGSLPSPRPVERFPARRMLDPGSSPSAVYPHRFPTGPGSVSSGPVDTAWRE